jgi:hypothetical protein
VNYVEANSDDEFAQENFMFSDDSKSSDGADNSDHDTEAGEDSMKAMNVEAGASDEEEDDSEDDNDEKIDYRIQHILDRKAMPASEWRPICSRMDTREVTRGSVLKQPDSEFFDKSDAAVEKFLIKWVHSSYVHVSWETEKDLTELVGSQTVAHHIKKYKAREETGMVLEAFESFDLTIMEKFPPAFLRVERVLDVDDPQVRPLQIDWKEALMPEPANRKDEKRLAEEVNVDVDTKNDEGIVTRDRNMESTNEKAPKARRVSPGSERFVSGMTDSPQHADVCDTPAVTAVNEGVNVCTEASTSAHANEGDANAEAEGEADAEADLDAMLDDEGILSSSKPASPVCASVCAPETHKEKPTTTRRSKRTAAVKRKVIVDSDSDDDDADNDGDEEMTGDPEDTATQADGEEFLQKGKIASLNDLKRKRSSKKVPYLHGNACWVTVKWEGMGYSDITVELIDDLQNAHIEYEAPLRDFYKREQMMPVKANGQRIITRSLKAIDGKKSILESDAPTFPGDKELRDYQWEGVRWLLFNWSQKRNSILADEMGLGKTIQTAAFLQMLKNHQHLRGPFLIVAPLSTVVNWQRELTSWTDMDVIVYHGSQEDRDLIRKLEFFYINRKKSDGYKMEVIVTSPETCVAGDTKASATGRVSRELSKVPWDMIVIDEAHKLKNHESKLSCTLRDDYIYRNCLLLTGTPLQNSTEELWTLLNFVDRKNFEDRDAFVRQFGSLRDAAQLAQLHKRLKPYLLRREKEHVEKTVPPKEEVLIEVELTVPQKQYYRAIYEMNTAFLYRGQAKDGPRLANLAMELRKCCNHPFLIKGGHNAIAEHFIDKVYLYA